MIPVTIASFLTPKCGLPNFYMRARSLLSEIFPKDVFESFQTLDRFSLAFGTVPRRLNIDRLIFILINIRQGQGNCIIDGMGVRLHPGKLMLVNPYSFLHLEDTKYVLGDVILFSESFFCTGFQQEQLLYKVLYQPGRQSHVLLESNTPARLFINSNMAMFGSTLAHSAASPQKNELLHSLLMNIILHLHKLQLATEGQTYDLDEPIAKKEVIQFIKLINQHFRQHHETEFYATQMNVPVKRLVTICQTGIGYTPRAVILSKLVLESCRLLRYDLKPVNDISFELGFTEPGNFSKFFLTQTGQTPGNYRIANNITITREN